MKANLHYTTEFTIINDFSESFSGEDCILFSRTEENGYEIDYLILKTPCGETYWTEWKRQYDAATNVESYIVGKDAEYDGAWNALNACQGVDFPKCEITNIRSTLGDYPSAEAYRVARIVIPKVQRVIASAQQLIPNKSQGQNVSEGALNSILSFLSAYKVKSGFNLETTDDDELREVQKLLGY